MYKRALYHQFGLDDFDQPLGFQMNPENRWVKKAEIIPWAAIEDKYAELFPSNTGMPAKPLRMALGSLLIQKQLNFSDRELVDEIVENPYFQYFIGLPGYQTKAPFAPSLLVEFRRRLSDDILNEINEMIIEYNTPDDSNPPDSGEGEDEGNEESGNSGTLILDATCAPQNISFPQDTHLLNECREDLEQIVDSICYIYNKEKPRMYRRNARNDFLEITKCKRKSRKAIRKAIKKQLQYVRRDLGYVDDFIENGVELSEKEKQLLTVIRTVYDQQKYMYENNVHTVPDRIVSISQPYIRPIVRGKAKAPVEFGAKLDLSVDENGIARIEKLSFNAYNESEGLINAVEAYKERTGHYPERLLADKIYRNRKNLSYCREKGIRMAGAPLGRPKKDLQKRKEDKKIEYRDSVDRIEVERSFSLAKRCFGLGLIRTKLDCTTRSSIALSILAMNVDRITAAFLHEFLVWSFSRFQRHRNRFEYRFIFNFGCAEISAGY